jgi:hypothetical protein
MYQREYVTTSLLRLAVAFNMLNLTRYIDSSTQFEAYDLKLCVFFSRKHYCIAAFFHLL